MGIQTSGIQTFDKSTQTKKRDNEQTNGSDDQKESVQSGHTVSDLVGVYKDIDDLFNVVSGHTDQIGRGHLETLRERVKTLTHMKITERKRGRSNMTGGD